MMASNSNEWISIGTCATSYADDYYRFDYNWSDPDPEFKPPLHQKRQRMEIQQSPVCLKGIGYVQQFKGYRYRIGNKNL